MTSISEPQIDISTWDIVEDFSTHVTYVGNVNGQQLRCEIQSKEDFVWVQLYDVSASEVVNETQTTDMERAWDDDAISTWIAESLAEAREEE